MRAWVVGNPSFPRTVHACAAEFELKSLHGAEEEARAVAAILGSGRTELFLGPQADRLRLEAWHAEPTVLHLATHGVACANDPLQSFLALSALKNARARLNGTTGQLTLHEDPRRPVTLDGLREIGWSSGETVEHRISFRPLLDAQSIIAWFRLRTDLVTLSACQTGLGQTLGQGTIGFTRAFLAAGARSVLVSLWSVDDQATKDLMTGFYDGYVRHGNKALALQEAMAETRRRYPQPRLWAPFTLVGLAE